MVAVSKARSRSQYQSPLTGHFSYSLDLPVAPPTIVTSVIISFDAHILITITFNISLLLAQPGSC